MNDTASTMIPADATLHLWGPAAVDPGTVKPDAGKPDAGHPDAFDHVVAAHRARHAGRPPELVVTPSYWGGRRRELLARALLRQGADAEVTDVATQLLAAEAPVAAHTILVELEPGRMCISRLDFGARTVACRLTHRTGDRLAIISDLTAELLADAGSPDDLEYIVTGDDGILAGLRRRGHLVFPVPEPELRRIHAEDREGIRVQAGAEVGVVRGAAPILDVAELRRRARAEEDTSASKKLRAPVGVAAGALLIVAFVAVTALMGGGPAGPGAGGGGADGSGGADGADDIAAAAIAEAGGEAPERATDSIEAEDGQRDDSVDGHVLRANGIQLTLPVDWEVDAGVRPDGLVAVNGGRMRVLAIATAVPEGTPLETLAASIGTLAADDPTADKVRRELVEGLDVVTHEERPGDGSVVYWQHRIVGPWQLSVGCQWRDPTIPQHRPICGQALRSAGVAGGA